MSVDPQDLPDDGPTYELVYPFILAESNGGPYPDGAFTAGFELGILEQRLRTLTAVEGDRTVITIRTDHIRQAELIAMHHGFPGITTEHHDDGWSTIVLTRAGVAS